MDVSENVAASVMLSPTQTVVYETAKAELLLFARKQLDVMGVNAKQLPADHALLFASLSKPTAVSMVPEDRPTTAESLTNATLQKALIDQASFDHLYISITSKITKGFQTVHRPRIVASLQRDLAMLHFSRKRFGMAAEIWEELLDKKDAHWDTVTIHALTKLVACYQHLGQTRDSSRMQCSCSFFIPPVN